MTDLAALKAAAQQAIDQVAEDLRALSLSIHSHPEVSFEEVHAHRVLTDYLEQHGFAVTRGAYELPTAFKAVAGSGVPVVAVLCEYDALPEIGHACGHNLIAAAGVAAGLALKEALGAGQGTVLVLTYNAISALRQQMTPDARVHGVFTKAGVKPNIIPDHTAAEFYLRAADDATLPDLKRRVLACFAGAATATGCRLEYRWTGGPYRNLNSNTPLAAAYRQNALLLGKTLPPDREEMGGPSTDMGNVSHTVPSIHPMFAIPTEAGNHTPEFTRAAATPAAHAAMLVAAKALAMTALDMFYRPEVREAARQDFRAAHPALHSA